MRFKLLVEGETEKLIVPGFLKRWLDPKLSKPVGIDVTRFDGSANAIRDIPVRTRRFLNEPDNQKTIAVIGLLDLYGLPPDFYRLDPGWDKHSVQQRYEWAKTKIESEVAQPDRFRQFFAVHELEAWLLSDLENAFPNGVKDALKNQKRINKPETINFDKPPAKLLEEIYLQKANRKYGKTVDGKKLFDKLDPQKAYDKCPYLKAMLDEMLVLAHSAGL